MGKGVEISNLTIAIWFAATLGVYYLLGYWLPEGMARRTIAAAVVGFPFAPCFKLSRPEPHE